MRMVDPTLPRDGTSLPLRGWGVSLTRRYRVTGLTSLPLRGVVRIVDPTLPRDGTDLIATTKRGAYR